MNNDLSKIRLVATDCDGVLTDGGMYYTADGDIMKKFNVIDGMGFVLLREAGIKTAIITAEKNPLLSKRAEKIKVDYLVTGTKDKLGELKKICEKENLELYQAAYIGDDIFDIPAIKKCGFGCVPMSAFENVKKEADYITQRRGGEGCFREVTNIILESRN
jgi:3-deoxy-D-manno-octulosonate 8-phosphate phosphatase, YrbI family